MLVDPMFKETKNNQPLFAFDMLASNFSFPSPDQDCFKLSVRVEMGISINERTILHSPLSYMGGKSPEDPTIDLTNSKTHHYHLHQMDPSQKKRINNRRNKLVLT